SFRPRLPVNGWSHIFQAVANSGKTLGMSHKQVSSGFNVRAQVGDYSLLCRLIEVNHRVPAEDHGKLARPGDRFNQVKAPERRAGSNGGLDAIGAVLLHESGLQPFAR